MHKIFNLTTYTSIEIKLSNHFFHFLLRWPSKRCRVKIVKLIEGEQFWKVGEGLVAYSVHNLIALLYLVNNVVTHFRVLSKTNMKMQMVMMMMLMRCS
jgi:hypothetical protein